MKLPEKLSSYWHEQSVKVRLWLLLALSSLIYLAATLAFPLGRYYTTIPPVDYAKLTHHSWLGFVVYVAGVTALFGFYTLSRRFVSQAGVKFRFVLVSGGVMALILAFSYPQTAIDLLVYALRTRGWVRYGLDPFSTALDRFPASDPWFGLAGEWVDASSPYGPIWEWFSLGSYHFSGGGYLPHLLALKALSVLTYLGSVWLLYRILLRYRPNQALAGTAFFAWNPLVLLEGVQNGHNDLSMVFFFLLATWGFVTLLVDEVTANSLLQDVGRFGKSLGKTSFCTEIPFRPTWGRERFLEEREKPKYLASVAFVLAFAGAILVKFIFFLVLPFFLLGLAARKAAWPRWISALVFYGAAILILVILIMLPYWPGMENWAVLNSGKSAGRSLMALGILALRPLMGTNRAFDTVQWVIYATLAGIYLWNLWRVWQLAAPRKKTKTPPSLKLILEGVFRASFYVLFWYILIGVSTFHAWYLLWIFPLAALSVSDRRLSKTTVAFSATALLIIPYYETIRVWFPYLLHNHLLGHIIGVALLIIPTLSANRR